ncbi:oxidoreductase [Paenibacillus sp. 1P07SE]|uniref:oxidoreductase n=1 Tax=Paenibacillus sp. 1P07SE TaxID=3132209 RepID=UPI0039A5AC9C
MAAHTEKWDEQHIPSQRGKVAIITGASGGLGLETAQALARKEATVILAVRSAEKGGKAKAAILNGFPDADVRVMQLDLSDLDSVHSFAESFASSYTSLDLLINNAGVMIPPYSQTKQGFELQMGTNHFGHYALTARLFPLLKRTPSARIVNVASSAHRMGKLNLDDLDWQQRKYKPWQAYGDSKLANLYFTLELDRRIKSSGLSLVTTAAHPGLAKTELDRTSGGVKLFFRLFGQDAVMGALPTLRAAVDPQLQGGEYLGPGGRMQMKGYPVLESPVQLAYDEDIARRLWEISEARTEVTFDFTPIPSGTP